MGAKSRKGKGVVDTGLMEATSKKEELRFGVDSGAALTVIRPDVATDYPVVNRCKRVLRAADGQAILDLGNKEITLKDGYGHRIVRTAVADVSKNLLSVAQLVDAGHEVIFSPKKSVIRHLQTGRVKEIERTNGVYEVSYQMEPYVTALRPGGLRPAAAPPPSWG